MARKPITNQQSILLHSSSISTDDDCACADMLIAPEFGQSVEVENDCACIGNSEAIQLPQVRAINYRKTAELFTVGLPNQFLLALPALSHTGPVVLNKSASEVLDSFINPHPVSTPLDYELVHAGLLLSDDDQHDCQSISPTTALTVWLHVTNACNLDCPYCYVRKSSATMKLETGRQVLSDIFKTAQHNKINQVKLKYAGGEASLHFDLVRRLHDDARQKAASGGIALSAVMLSNGTCLQRAEADWLAETRVRLMISVDGVGAAHDQMRTARAGQGTFEQIEKVIDQILIPTGVRPTISVTITAQNANQAAEIVRWVLDRDLPLSLNFYRMKAPDLASDALAQEAGLVIASMLEAFEVIKARLPERPFLNGLLDRVRFGAHAKTCGVGQGYLVVTTEGRLAQCHMQLDQAIPLQSGANLLAESRLGDIRNPPVEQKIGCQACPFRYYCTGGCPLETFRWSGEWNQSSPNCQIYRELIPHALHLEGLRIMKVRGYL